MTWRSSFVVVVVVDCSSCMADDVGFRFARQRASQSIVA